MKRALIVGTGTVVGIAAVLALNPDGTSVAAGLPSIAKTSGTTTAGASTVGNGSTGSGSSGSGSSGSGSTGSGSTGSTGTRASAAPSAAASSGGTASADGSAVDVGYGIVQVHVTLTGGKITDITAVQLPQNDGHSARISQQAYPMLVQQALQAQSSQISGVSGASYTSYGFAESLKAALTSLGHAA